MDAPTSSPSTTCSCTACHRHGPSSAQLWAEALAMVLLVILLTFVANAFGLTRFAHQTGSAASIGGAVVIGLVAATSSCLAAVGGLLLSVSASWCEAHPEATRWQQMRPMLLFNGGRLVGYFVLGGVVGLLGQMIAPSVRATGLLMVLLAVVMVWLGLRMLQLLPQSLCHLPKNSALGREIAKLSKKPGIIAPMILGALTFFIPCGFTQSMQLTALTTQSFWHGGALMLAFALGTLPALIGISFISSNLRGEWGKGFFRLAGALVLVLGLLNLRSGLLQSGIDVQGAIARAWTGQRAPQQISQNVTIDGQGRQIVSIAVSDQGYSPASVTIEPGKPTWIYATAAKPLTGCASFLTAPAYNLSVPVAVGGNWLGPINDPRKDFVLTCSMGRLKMDVHVNQS